MAHFLNSFLRLIFYWPMRVTTTCTSIPPEPLTSLRIDPLRPIAYVTVSSSVGNLMAIERLTERLGLPSPFSRLELGGQRLTRVAYLRLAPFFSHRARKVGVNAVFDTWQQACRAQHTDLQIIPVTVLWSRNPSFEGLNLTGINTPTPSCRKFLTLAFAGRSNCTIISDPYSCLTLAHRLTGRHANLLNRMLARHFLKTARGVVGKPFPERRALLRSLLRRPGTQAAIAAEQQASGTPRRQLELQAYRIFDRMAADTRYPLLNFLSGIISLLWRRFYHGQTIIGAERVREMILKGYEIIYIPCHRTHMDYILLSFVIFREGLAIPQVASGDNLNFFPVGPFIRRCGAYFIRRKIKGDTFYSSLFREYMAMLFENGYATEFFIEGGRSRTGRTLPPKTGMVAMTVQAQLRGIERPIAFIPVYLGYEHVMEVGSYMKELEGARKKREGPLQLLGIFRRLRYYGRGYVSFGEPVVVTRFLNAQVPHWRRDLDPLGDSRPPWLRDTVTQLAREIIIRLNDAALVNGINLCAMALISAEDRTLSMGALENCLRLYLDLLRCDARRLKSVPREEDPRTLIGQALELNKFHLYDVIDNVYVRPSRGQTLQLTYFQNNVLHLFALPALVAGILISHGRIDQGDLIYHTRSLFYFLRHELFVPVSEGSLDYLTIEYLKCFVRRGYVTITQDEYVVEGECAEEFRILARAIYLNLARYLVAAEVLEGAAGQEACGEEAFAARCVSLARQLPADMTRDSPEFADPIVFTVMCATFRRHRYYEPAEGRLLINHHKVQRLLRAVRPLLAEKDAKIIHKQAELAGMPQPQAAA